VGNWLSTWGQNKALNIEQLIAQTDQQTSAFSLQQTEQLEAWQRWLWQNYFHDDFVEIQSIDADFWQLLDDQQTRPRALAQLPSQVIVFTILDLPPSQLQFLRRLGQYLDVVILHYNPSQEYWADSVDPLWKKRYDLGVKERYIAKHPNASDADIAAFFDSFSLGFNALSRESRHPLLTRLGKQARDHFSLLSQLAGGEEGIWEDLFVDYFPETLLGKVQSDIFYLAEPQAGQYELASNDESIQLHVCHSSLRQLEVLKEQDIHLVLMDIMMPEMDGIAAMVKIRETSNVPVILLTAKSEDTDKVLGLTVGADDYITKPFNPIEVQARVKSQLRRYMQLGGGAIRKDVLSIGGIELDDRSKEVSLDGEKISLTRTEYDILKLLMEHPGEVFSPNQIYEQVWQDNPYGTENTVAVHIRHLREKVEYNPAEPRYLKVVWGRGYKMEGQV
jgi:DNA-binding response OmpR family regulator